MNLSGILPIAPSDILPDFASGISPGHFFFNTARASSGNFYYFFFGFSKISSAILKKYPSKLFFGVSTVFYSEISPRVPSSTCSFRVPAKTFSGIPCI